MGLLRIFQTDPVLGLFYAATIIIGITVHEAAHSWTAYRLGDPTPEVEGRVTLDPLAHLDPIGSLAILLIGFGWGRPAPFNPTYFKHYKRDTALTAIAGPISNFLLVSLSIIALRLVLPLGSEILDKFLIAMIETNLILMVFNLIPIPPLDGSKLVYAVLPDRYDHLFHSLEQLGPFLIIIIFLFSGAFFTTIYDPIVSIALTLAGAQ